MKHMLLRALAAALILICLAMPALADTLHVEGLTTDSDVYKQFVRENPEIDLKFESIIYNSTDELIGEMLTGEFPYDVFTMYTQSFDIDQLIAKGYCASLPDNPLIAQKIGEMYPSVQQQFIRDGVIYGVPYESASIYYAYVPETWEAAGLSAKDVPTSFTGLLDFLDMWAERIADEPEYNICVTNVFDSELYDENSYISYLVQRLVENYIMQRSYADEPLRFDTPIFTKLLNRCVETGKALYENEPEQKGEMQLFNENGYSMADLATLVPLRMTEDQPILIRSMLTAYFLNAASPNKELALKFIETSLAALSDRTGAYLYSNAAVVEDPQYEPMVEEWQGRVAEIERQLENTQDMDPLARAELEITQEVFIDALEDVSNPRNRYIVPQEELDVYRSYGDSLYFQPPSVFDPNTENGQNVRQLMERFCSGSMDAAEFVERLDQLAAMIEMENQ
ncbi:MAG: extracellular solute-binding protein [Clostridiales bacterium]|nr:extracellular solute-binding protein [Clostridiales bacterium]